MEASPTIRPSHRVEISSRMQYLEVTSKIKIEVRNNEHIDHVHYYTTSYIGSAFFTLPINVQGLTGSIPVFHEPTCYPEDAPIDLIITTYGSVLFGVRRHGCIITMSNEQIMLRGGGTVGGPLGLMSSHRLALGGISAGLAVLGLDYKTFNP
jgi:predicted nucleotidyltransferase